MTPALLALCALLAAAAPDPRSPAPAESPDVFTQLADEVSAKILATPNFKERSDPKLRVVVGRVANSTDDEGVRVDDIQNEIRNQIVSSGVVRLYDAGRLDVDYILASELTSRISHDAHGRRLRCLTLNLTLSRASGEFISAQSAYRCL